MILVRLKYYTYMIWIGMFFLLLTVGVLFDLWLIIIEGQTGWEEFKWLLFSIPMYLFLFILISIGRDFRLIFTEKGIIRREVIRIKNIMIKNKEYKVKWEDINEINYFRFPIFQPYWGFEITSDTKMPYPGILAILNWMYKNSDEAIKYTINRLDPSKCEITKKARKALRKKYGIDVDKVWKKEEQESRQEKYE